MIFAVLGALIVGLLMVFISWLTIPDGNFIGAFVATCFVIVIDGIISLFVAILSSTFDEESAGPVGIVAFVVIMLIAGIWMTINV